MKSILISSLGKTEYKEIVYFLGKKESKTKFAPVAIAELAEKPDDVLLLLTKEAMDVHFDTVANEFREKGIPVRCHLVPIAEDEDDIYKIFLDLCDLVEEKSKVILDVTFSLRHLPFIYFSVLSYLVPFKNVEISKIYYGAFELKDKYEGKAPIFDITALFKIVDLYHGLKTFKDSGDMRSFSKSLEELKSDFYKKFAPTDTKIVGLREIGRKISKATSVMDRISKDFYTGLPLEVGAHSKKLIDGFSEFDKTENSLLEIVRKAILHLKDFLTPISFKGGFEKKSLVPLTHDELKRELEVIKYYLEFGGLRNALTLLREWVVSYVLFVREEKSWLTYFPERKKAEILLNSLAEKSKKEEFKKRLNKYEITISSLWQKISELRNSYAHAGMKDKWVEHKDLRESLDQARYLFEILKDFHFSSCPYKRLLISSLGLSPGLLFSAIRKTNPDGVFLITSKDAVGKLDEVLNIANYKGKLEKVVLEDPFLGYREGKDKAKSFLPYCLDFEEIFLNLTGGTTVMQFVIEDFGESLKKYGANIKKIALVDKRSLEEQKENPYVEGEILHLDFQNQA